MQININDLISFEMLCVFVRQKCSGSCSAIEIKVTSFIYLNLAQISITSSQTPVARLDLFPIILDLSASSVAHRVSILGFVLFSVSFCTFCLLHSYRRKNRITAGGGVFTSLQRNEINDYRRIIFELLPARCPVLYR